MDVLFAPWRIQYVLSPKSPSQPGQASLFTQIAASEDDEANLVIGRGRTCYALLNAYPYNGGHVMVVPYRPLPGLDGLMDEELLELMIWVRRVQEAIRRVMKPDGFNIGINLGKVAGAGIVEHLHVHIVPRWDGDTNFMPILAATNVVPEALLETAAKLRESLRSVGDGDS